MRPLAWLTVLVACSAYADDAPAWLTQAARSDTPKYPPKVGAVVLYQDTRVDVEEGGKRTTSTSYAVRILTREGRDAAIGRQIYTTSSGKVKEMHGWLIRPSGEVKKFSKDRILDIALADNDVYNEVRVRALVATTEAEPGSVFGYEAVVEEKSVFMQDEFEFQRRLPVMLARYTVALPAGWQVAGVLYNHAPVPPKSNGATYSWELRALPPIDVEPASPSLESLAPRLAVSIRAPEGAKTGLGKRLDNWSDVAQWLSELADAQMTTTGDLIEKAQSLTAGAKTGMEKIRAIGRYVQNVRYVAIQTGLGRGGGYRPHTAAEVFQKGYGDCKDKANLMRTMLKAVGVEAYPVAIYSGDRERVRDDWPSPQQFNHCIVAARVGPGSDAAALLRHPDLGDLLIFDPTDEHTQPGNLPQDEENSLALIVSPQSNSLVRMPSSGPLANRIERDVEATLTETGALQATVCDRAFGHAGVDMRREQRRRSEADYRKHIEHWLSASATGAALKSMKTADDANSGTVDLDMEVAAEQYGRTMQNRLLIFRPSILDRYDPIFLTEKTRKYPVVLTAESFAEKARIKLPSSFQVDELQDAFELTTPFGSYRGRCVPKDGELQCMRALEIKTLTVPPEQYRAVREFFSRIAAYEQSPVVLAR